MRALNYADFECVGSPLHCFISCHYVGLHLSIMRWSYMVMDEKDNTILGLTAEDCALRKQ